MVGVASRYALRVESEQRRSKADPKESTASLSQQSDDSQGLAWRARQREAASRHDELVTGVLVEVARNAWGAARGRRWEVVATPDEAAWRLYHVIGPRRDDRFEFEQLGVRATIDPSGALVAFQVDDGDDFLALADTSVDSLQRGLLHLLSKELPVRAADQPPFAFAVRRGPIARLQALLRGRSEVERDQPS